MPDDSVWLPQIFILVIGTVFFSYPLICRTFVNIEIDYNEGWNAYRQLMAATGVPLYGAPPTTQITNYLPASFHLIGLLSRLTGDVVRTGRLVSWAALAVLCLCVGAVTKTCTGSRLVAIYAGLTCLAWIELWSPDRIGVNDPHLIGMALEMLGLYAFVSNPRRAANLVACAVLLGLALLVKQTFLAVPAGIAAGLLTAPGAFRAPSRGRLLLLAGSAGILACSALAAIIAFDGPFLASTILMPRAYLYRQAASELARYAVIFAPMLAINTIWCIRALRDAPRRHLAIGWIVAQALAIGFAGGDGVAPNIFMEPLAIGAVVLAVALHDQTRASGQRASWKAQFLAFAPLAYLLIWSPSWVAFAAPQSTVPAKLQASFTTGAALLRSVRGPVLCENLLMCFRADKPSAFDPYYMRDQIRIHRAPLSGIVALVAGKRLAAVEIGAPPDTRPLSPGARLRIPGAFMRSLLENYHPVFRASQFTILLPDRDPAAPVARRPPGTTDPSRHCQRSAAPPCRRPGCPAARWCRPPVPGWRAPGRRCR